jgi:hypothetical protein|nr:MAG TPA: Protein of unknown function (DUF2829) [Caudoviricetes sp.]DAM12971.1 MAG TPA: Protein of unknown function (DUF2829) [Caudoviricetes sp.]
MALDRVFSTPTITVDQDKYDELIKISDRYEQLIKKEKELFDFGKAIQYLKEGKRLQRQGWNGKKQYIELATNISYKNANDEIINAEHDAIGNKAIAFVGTSGIQLGWLASQADMLAEDWKIVEEEK